MKRMNLLRTLLASVLFAFAGASVAQDPVPTEHVQIEALHGETWNNCLQAPPLGVNPRYIETECLPVDSRQMFTFEFGGDAWYIRNAESARCLKLDDDLIGVLDAACKQGDPKFMWNVTGRNTGTGFLGTIQSHASQRCLAYFAGQLQVFTCEQEPAWLLVKQDDRAPRGYVRLKVARGGLCMSQDEWPVLRECDHMAKYDAISTSTTGESFKLNNYEDGTCLVLSQSLSDPNNQYVRNMACDNANANWRLHPVGDKWIVQHIASGLCLNARYGASTAGTPLIVWSCVQTSDNMLWSMTRK